jgi:hypothetical protein
VSGAAVSRENNFFPLDKTVWFCLRYENEKGGEEGEGPFGPLFSAIIP